VHDADRVQLCAQALCLEEMLRVHVLSGSLYYGTTRRRTEVSFDERLRSLTELMAARLHVLIASGRTPRAGRERKCDQCSLETICMPDALSHGRSAKRYTEFALEASIGTEIAPDDK
jgi:CRISPR-associated exonuclease Cas4